MKLLELENQSTAFYFLGEIKNGCELYTRCNRWRPRNRSARKQIEAFLKPLAIKNYTESETDCAKLIRVDATFFMEQDLGHQVYDQKLHRFIDGRETR